jgi:hypothetical protein
LTWILGTNAEIAVLKDVPEHHSIHGGCCSEVCLPIIGHDHCLGSQLVKLTGVGFPVVSSVRA